MPIEIFSAGCACSEASRLKSVGACVSAVKSAACWSWAGGVDLVEVRLDGSQLPDARCSVCSFGLTAVKQELQRDGYVGEMVVATVGITCCG